MTQTKKQDDKLDQLRKLEAEAKAVVDQNQEIDNQDNISSNNESPNMLDGFKLIQNYELPQNGELYPDTWNFAYRCPKSIEVANFSVIHDRDNPALINAIQDLIKKCVVIYDTEFKKQISSGFIFDCHQTFFILLLRDFYLSNIPIENKYTCTLCHEGYDSQLTASKLIYPELSDKLLSAYNKETGLFTLNWPGIEEPIKFLIPNINRSSQIFKYIVKAYKDAENDRDKKDDVIIYDKQFLLLAPYLYEKGTENIRDLIAKFKLIKANEKLFKAYLEIISKLKLENLEYINDNCPHCGSLEENQIRFPGGWKNMFISRKDTSGYF